MNAPRGMSLMDVIVGSAMVLIVFVALVGLLRASILITGVSKVRAGATAIAETQMEYLRGLSYDSVGTTNGIPSGVVMATSTQVLNGITYDTRTLITYVDDPADGLGASDTNGIATDYKRAKVEVTYTVRDGVRNVSLVSNIAPLSLESTTNGGTLSIVVVGATVTPVPGATVFVVNNSTSPTVSFSTFTNSAGIVQLPGAPASADYQITVSKTGYSTATTYARDATNQNPTPGYLTVVQGQTTTSTFSIDALSPTTFSTWFPIQAASTTDTFSTSSGLASQTNTQVSGGALSLLFSGGYALSGSADGIPVTPARLVSWTSASSTRSLPTGTTARLQVLDGSGVVLPDGVLPGNSAGFDSFPVSLSGIATSTYSSLALRALLTTTSTTTTSSVLDWRLDYTVGPTPVPNVAFTLSGAKTIGSTGAGLPLYKTTVNATTDASGVRALSLEWDTYKLSVAGYDTVDACAPPLYVLAPGITYSHALYVGTRTTNAALVSVHDNLGAPVQGVSVTLSRTGYTKNVTTSSCGTAYFGALTDDAYSITATKPGFTDVTYTNVPVSGHLFYDAVFP
jgi:hypothetical protein